MGKEKIIVNGVAVGEYEPTGDRQADLKTMAAWLDEHGYRPPATPGFSIFSSAKQFALAVKYLYDSDIADGPRRRSRMECSVPFIVNAAFAIELYLKALLVQYGVEPGKVHELSDLYGVLPLAARELIGKKLVKAAGTLRLPPGRDFVADITALDKAFVHWRYCYEHEWIAPFEILPTFAIAVALHEAFEEVDQENQRKLKGEKTG